MRKPILAILAAILVSLACTQVVTSPSVSGMFTAVAPSPTPAPTQERPTATPAAAATVTEDVDTLTIQAIVYLRAEPDAESAEIGSLETGAVVEVVECQERWCNITATIDGKRVAGWVFRGCTSDPNDLLCEAR